MVTQVQQFQQLSAQLRSMGCTITVHGTGLLPYVAKIQLLGEQIGLNEQEGNNAKDAGNRDVRPRYANAW